MKQRWALLAAALLLVSAVLLAACEDASQSEEPTSTATQPPVTTTATNTAIPSPRSVPSPTTTRTPTQVSTPTLTPGPPASPIIEYARQCEIILVSLDGVMALEDPDTRWDLFAQAMDQVVQDYRQLVPPPEFVDFHEANLDALIAVRQAASGRDSSDSFGNDLDTFTERIVNELLSLSIDESRTDEEKNVLFQEILGGASRELFGQDAYAHDQNAQEALDALPQQAKEVLDHLGCLPMLYFPSFGAGSGTTAGNPMVEADRAALVALYIATDGPSWNHSANWATDAPIGEWQGVVTDAAGRVMYLKLSENRMNGEIPSELGSLSSLKLLDLNNNLLRGEIPAELGNLSNLEVLALRSNQLTGEIPLELGNLTNLGVLQLNGNELSGEIPLELANLTSLVNLSLGSNLLSGEIPPELGNLTNLDTLSLSRNELRGEIPPELGNLTNLSTLSLGNNELSGEIPPELGNLTGLSELFLSRTLLTGTIPIELENLNNLYSLRLSHNFLTGCVPSALKDVSNHDIHETPRLSFCD